MEKCPKCGSKLIYIGVTNVECGEDSGCENWSKKQAIKVNKMQKEGREVEINDYGIPFPEFDDDETNSMFPLPLFVSTP